MKAGWEVRQLGEAFQTATGNTPPKSAAHYYGRDIPLVKPPELIDGEVSEASDGLTASGAEVARVAPEGSVLVSCIGNLGKIGLASRPLAFNQQINAIYPDLSVSLPRFTFYSTLSPQFRRQLDALAAGTTVSIVNKSRFNSIEVPLPPLEEQRRIVAVLDEAFEGLARARENTETNLANARELFAGAMDEALSDPELSSRTMSLADIVTEDCTLSYGIVQPGDEIEDGLPTVRPVDLGAQYVNLRGVKRIDPARASSYARTTLVGGELLLCVRGSTGTISIAENELSGANVTRGIVPIRLNGEILLPEVAYYCFLSRSVQQQIAAATYGAALQQINIKDVRKLQIPVPSIVKQGELLGRLSQLSEHCQTLVAGAKKDVTDLDDLRQSLLQKTFAGELT